MGKFFQSAAVPPVYAIALPEEPWKRKLLLEEFGVHGITPKIVDGIFGVTFGLKTMVPYDYAPNGSYTYIHASQLGCVLSHRIALGMALADGHPEFIVAETDVCLADDFLQKFRRWRSELPKDTTVAQLAFYPSDRVPDDTINETSAVMHYPFSSTCIWWTREAARFAIRAFAPVDRPFDIMLMQRVYPFQTHAVAFPPIAYDKSSTKEWATTVPFNVGNL